MSFEINKSEVISDFNLFDSWEERYEHLIDLGKALKPLDLHFKNNSNLVEGCQANVWLVCEIKNEKLNVMGDSDAIITRGLVALLVRLFNNCSVKEIIHTNNSFLDEIGLNKHLSMTRSNGINAMIKKIHEYCLNYIKK